MKYITVLLLSLSLLAVALSATTLENCKCWKDFEAKEVNGRVECHGLLLKMKKPCNMPAAVKCVCTEDSVTGILSDGEGTWCSQSKGGKLLKKWPCENQDEWKKYKEDYAQWHVKYLEEKEEEKKNNKE